MAERLDSRAERRGRQTARRLALQALYQWQLNDQSAADIIEQFTTAEDYERADREYFAVLVAAIIEAAAELDARLGEYIDRPAAELDPVEHAALLIGAYELAHRIEVPYRVAINEAVELAKRYGATDGHKYVNAVLDRAARSLRSIETSGAS